MATQIPTFTSHTFKQEVQIAEGPNAPKKPVIGYQFNGGKRQFYDKVDKNRSYD